MVAMLNESAVRDFDLEFRDMTGQRRVAVTAAGDRCVAEVLPAVRARMKLADHDSDGEPIHYRVHQDLDGVGRTVSPSERIGDLCAAPADRPHQFVVHQEVVAG